MKALLKTDMWRTWMNWGALHEEKGLWSESEMQPENSAGR
jgi:hypothetical protein